MKRDAATTIRHLKTLGETIDSALVASLGGAFVSASVFKYIELSAELPDDDDAHADAKAEIAEKSKTFAVRLAEIEKSSAGNVPLPPNAAATPDAPRWPLPKEKPITHDGEMETFPAFWKLFRKRVLKKVPDKEMKHVLLCHAVSSADLKHIAGLSLTKSKEFLLKKYTSASAVRGYLVKKFEKPQMCHEDDAEGLMELREATATALLVASECDNTDVLPELFDLAYCRLPREVQRRGVAATPDETREAPYAMRLDLAGGPILGGRVGGVVGPPSNLPIPDEPRRRIDDRVEARGDAREEA